MDSLKSVEEAAATLGLSPWTVRLYLRQGKIRPVRIGRRVLIEPQEILRIIEAGRNPSATLPTKNTATSAPMTSASGAVLGV
jgi:excisionase family DNA binding protein